MRLSRPTRLVTTVTMVAASLAFSGGAILATASPASAFTQPTVSCSGLAATIDLSTLTVAGNLSHCQLGRIPLFFNGAIVISPLDLSGGPSPGTVTYGKIFGFTLQTGISVSAVIGVGDCSAFPQYPINATLTTTVVSGLGKGLLGPGGGVICTDGVTLVNAGPITL